MNIIDGLTAFKVRKNYNNIQLAELLGCSSSVVSLYLSGKSGLSLEKLSILLKEGMTLEEAFGEDVAKAVKDRIIEENRGKISDDSMALVVDGLQKMLDPIRESNSNSLATR